MQAAATPPENQRALFLLAAGLRDALHPDDPLVHYDSLEIVELLVERELTRLRRSAANQGLEESAFALLLSVAAFAGELSLERVRELSGREELGLGLPRKIRVSPTKEGRLEAPKPDIIASIFAARVLGQNPETAPESILGGLEGDLPGGLERSSRLSHDAEMVLGLRPFFGAWLSEAVAGNVKRAASIEPLFGLPPFPRSWLPAAITAGKGLLESDPEDEERGRLLSNLSVHPSEAGDRERWRPSARRWRLTAGWPRPPRRATEPDLAFCLNNLSNRMAEAGDRARALKALREAVGILRRLTEASPARHEPDLATSLGASGRIFWLFESLKEAVAAFKEGADLIRPYAEKWPESPASPLLANLETDLRGTLERIGGDQAPEGGCL